MKRIERLVLKNYKSLENVPIPMGNLNVLIGQNGSGKSNFLSFFHLLREGADGSLLRAINDMGGLSQIAYYGQPRLPIEWDITLTERDPKTNTEQKISYKGKLGRRGNVDYIIQLEEISRPLYPGRNKPQKYLDASNGIVKFLQYGNWLEGEAELKKNKQTDSLRIDPDLGIGEFDHELVISQIRNRIEYPILAEVRSLIADWSIFSGFGTDALKNMRDSQSIYAVEKLRLDPLGKNLVSILQQLENSPNYEAANERLNDSMRTVFEDFKRLDILAAATGKVELYYRSSNFSKQIPAQSMSDGQLRFLGLAILLLLPDPPALIAIDEPEIGMHPRMLAVFAELLKEASERTQIVVSTHSPQLVDLMRPEDVIIVEQTDGKTQLSHVSTDKLQVWLERYTLGRLWTMGKLETA